MLVIRLTRIGKKNQPSFKIVVTDKRKSSRGGRAVEVLGFYNPLTKKKNIKKERVQYWLKNGAKPSATLHNLLVGEKIIEGKKINVFKKKKIKEGVPAAPAPAGTPAVAQEPPKEALKEVPPTTAPTPAQTEVKPAEPTSAPQEQKPI